MFDYDEWFHLTLTRLLEKPCDWLFCSEWRTLRMIALLLVVPWALVVLLLALIVGIAEQVYHPAKDLFGEVKKVWDGPVCSEEESDDATTDVRSGS